MICRTDLDALREDLEGVHNLNTSSLCDSDSMSSRTAKIAVRFEESDTDGVDEIWYQVENLGAREDDGNFGDSESDSESNDDNCEYYSDCHYVKGQISNVHVCTQCPEGDFCCERSDCSISSSPAESEESGDSDGCESSEGTENVRKIGAESSSRDASGEFEDSTDTEVSSWVSLAFFFSPHSIFRRFQLNRTGKSLRKSSN